MRRARNVQSSLKRPPECPDREECETIGRPSRPRLQRDEHPSGTPESCADSEGRRTRAIRLGDAWRCSERHCTWRGVRGIDSGAEGQDNQTVAKGLRMLQATGQSQPPDDRRMPGRTEVCVASLTEMLHSYAGREDYGEAIDGISTLRRSRLRTRPAGWAGDGLCGL